MEKDEEKIKGVNGWSMKDQVEKKGKRERDLHCHGRKTTRLWPINQRRKCGDFGEDT
jgi:hypothetical protein